MANRQLQYHQANPTCEECEYHVARWKCRHCDKWLCRNCDQELHSQPTQPLMVARPTIVLNEVQPSNG